MNKIIIFSYFLLATNKLIACCGQEEISFFPSTNSIIRNGIIVINLPNSLGYKIESLHLLSWKAINSDGKVYELKSRIIGAGRTSQVILTHKGYFKLNDTLEIHFEYNNQKDINENNYSGGIVNKIAAPEIRIETSSLNQLAKALENRKWGVNKIIDIYFPHWHNDTLEYSIHDHSSSSTHGYSIIFRPKVRDKVSKKSNYSDSAICLFEVSHNGQKIICFDNICKIGYSICGSNMSFPNNIKCEFTIKCLDYAGNYNSKEINSKVFTTVLPNEIIIEN